MSVRSRSESQASLCHSAQARDESARPYKQRADVHVLTAMHPRFDWLNLPFQRRQPATLRGAANVAHGICCSRSTSVIRRKWNWYSMVTNACLAGLNSTNGYLTDSGKRSKLVLFVC